MAKSKHSVALFEVIQASRSSSGMDSLRTPKWWFKRRAVIGSMSGEPVAAVEPLASLPEPPSVPAVFEPQNIDTAPVSSSAPRSTALDLSHDPDRRRISFHFTYNSAIISAFAVIVVVSLAYIVGQHMKQGPSTALAGPSSEQVQAGPISKNVLNVSTASVAQAAAAKKPTIAAPDKLEPLPGAPKPIATPAPLNDNTATTAPSGQRVGGLNYIVAQGYPQLEKQMAYDACDLLNKNGIPCTVELNVKGYSYYNVVTLKGFGRVSSGEFTAYEKAILAVNEKMPKASFKRFNPTAKKW